jgi:trans-2,3-dihydro-3-hydroxyanthranilate isomerase
MEPVSAGLTTRRRFSFVTADVFTRQPLTGNPLAVFPEAKGLSPAEMQAIARELNLSETVFVFPPENPAHTRKLRIFTPGGELPFAGHPTLGAAHVLAATARIPTNAVRLEIVLEEAVGPVKVGVELRDGVPVRTELEAFRLPEKGPAPPPRETLARALSLRVQDLAESDADQAECWSCGVPFLFVPLADPDALSRARLDRGLWQSHLAGLWAPHVYPFARAASGREVDARMFAPAMGIEEDPGTGAAAAALAGYLGTRTAPGESLSVVIRQGAAMGRPSTLFVSATKEGAALTSVRVAGESVLVSEGTLWV